MSSHTEPRSVPAALLVFDHMPESAGVALPVVTALCGNPAASTIWRWSKTGRLPRPYKAGPNRTLWNVGELRIAIAKMRAAPQAPQGAQ